MYIDKITMNGVHSALIHAFPQSLSKSEMITFSYLTCSIGYCDGYFIPENGVEWHANVIYKPVGASSELLNVLLIKYHHGSLRLLIQSV